jgi:uncharacterized protein YuzE
VPARSLPFERAVRGLSVTQMNDPKTCLQEMPLTKHTVTFDSAHKLAYVYAAGRTTNRGQIVRTVDVELKKTTLYLDIDESGHVLGVEVLAPSRVSLAEVMQQFSKKFKPRRLKRRPPKVAAPTPEGTNPAST